MLEDCSDPTSLGTSFCFFTVAGATVAGAAESRTSRSVGQWDIERPMPATILASDAQVHTKLCSRPEPNTTATNMKTTHHVRLCLAMVFPLEATIRISIAVAQSCRLEVRWQSAADLGCHGVYRSCSIQLYLPIR